LEATHFAKSFNQGRLIYFQTLLSYIIKKKAKVKKEEEER
jgi:hypothetical protein